MIVEGAIDLFFGIFGGLFSGLQFLGLPVEFINTLNSILCYGTWIIGADLMALIVSSIIAWWTIKFVVGLILWVWELLPLT